MKKFLVLSSVIGSVTAPALAAPAISKVTLILLTFIFGLGATPFVTTPNAIATAIIAYATSFFTAGGITPSELLTGI